MVIRREDKYQFQLALGFSIPELAVKVVGNAEPIFEQKVILIGVGKRVLALLVDAGPIPLHEVLPDPLQEHEGHAPPCRLIGDHQEH